MQESWLQLKFPQRITSKLIVALVEMTRHYKSKQRQGTTEHQFVLSIATIPSEKLALDPGIVTKGERVIFVPIDANVMTVMVQQRMVMNRMSDQIVHPKFVPKIIPGLLSHKIIRQQGLCLSANKLSVLG